MLENDPIEVIMTAQMEVDRQEEVLLVVAAVEEVVLVEVAAGRRAEEEEAEDKLATVTDQDQAMAVDPRISNNDQQVTLPTEWVTTLIVIARCPVVA
jgi:hypothetical protein